MEKMIFNCHEKGEVQQPDNKAGSEVLCVCVCRGGPARPGGILHFNSVTYRLREYSRRSHKAITVMWP